MGVTTNKKGLILKKKIKLLLTARSGPVLGTNVSTTEICKNKEGVLA